LQSHHSKGSEVCCNVFFPFSKSCIARGLRSSNLVLQLTWRYYCRTSKKQQPISRYNSWDIWPTAKAHNSNVMAVDGFLLHRCAALVVWDFMLWIHSLVVWDFMSWIHQWLFQVCVQSEEQGGEMADETEAGAAHVLKPSLGIRMCCLSMAGIFASSAFLQLNDVGILCGSSCLCPFAWSQHSGTWWYVLCN
jgi:hypothetical protein